MADNEKKPTPSHWLRDMVVLALLLAGGFGYYYYRVQVGKQVLKVPIGVGKGSTPTPGGQSWIREKLNGFGNAVYGPLAFGTATYSNTLTDWPGGGVVGIHGTNEPNLIPGRPSHGCIRLKNKDIVKLSHKMAPGTPVLIK